MPLNHLKKFLSFYRKNHYDFSSTVDVFQELIDEFGLEKYEESEDMVGNYYRSSSLLYEIQEIDPKWPDTLNIKLYYFGLHPYRDFTPIRTYLEGNIVPTWKQMGLFVKVREERYEDAAVIDIAISCVEKSLEFVKGTGRKYE